MRLEELTQNLKLNAFYTAFIEQETQPAYSDMPFTKRVQMLLEAETLERDNKKIQRLLRQAKLHDKSATINEINFTIDRGLDKSVILDDFEVSPLKAAEARDLLEIAEDRTNQSSLIITSQLPIQDWHSYLHNATIADAILDRIVHNAYKIELSGESQRKEKAKNMTE